MSPARSPRLDLSSEGFAGAATRRLLSSSLPPTLTPPVNHDSSAAEIKTKRGRGRGRGSKKQGLHECEVWLSSEEESGVLFVDIPLCSICT